MINIEFIEIKENSLISEAATNAANTAIQNQEVDLSIVFCDNPYIQQLNSDYRHIDRPTDVLSFPSEEVDPESGERYLGDIVISLPQAESQANEAGNPVTSEVSMLVIHGVLHLLGYDHTIDSEKKTMWHLQEMLLASMGIKMSKFSGDEE